jgi:glutathione-regulated potassium-efflux system ancillary protein KefG
MPGPVLVILAHPALHRSRANVALLRAVDAIENVIVHDLYETYPDYLIDVGREQRRLTECGALVCQHPFYWYSAPGLLKEWFDLVLTHGFAYGVGGTALRGKPWLTAVTTGGPESAYRAQGPNRFSIAELLRPIEATAHLCAASWRPPFALHGGRMMDDDALAAQAQAYRARIEALERETNPAPGAP